MGLLRALGSAVGSALWSGTKTVGKAALSGIGTAGYYGGVGIAKGAKITAGVVAKGLTKAADGAVYLAKDAYAARDATNYRNPFGQFVHSGKAMIKGMGDWERAKDVYDPLTGEVKHTDGHFKLGTFGKVAFFGPAIAAGTYEGAQKYEDDRVGQIDSNIVTATPNYAPSKTPSYANNCGATGDLVFALHNNRHG